MKRSLRLLLYCCLLLYAMPSSAQPGGKLSAQQLQDFKEQAQQKLESLKLFFVKIGSKETDARIKDMYITQSNRLFKPESIVQVSTKGGGLQNYPVTQYLAHLKNYAYQVVIIEYVAEGSYFGDFKEVWEDGKVKYVSTAKVVQKFCGYFDARQAGELGTCDYEDTTEKQVEIVLEKYKAYDNQEHWVVKIGDITVLRTT